MNIKKLRLGQSAIFGETINPGTQPKTGYEQEMDPKIDQSKTQPINSSDQEEETQPNGMPKVADPAFMKKLTGNAEASMEKIPEDAKKEFLRINQELEKAREKGTKGYLGQHIEGLQKKLSALIKQYPSIGNIKADVAKAAFQPSPSLTVEQLQVLQQSAEDKKPKNEQMKDYQILQDRGLIDFGGKITDQGMKTLSSRQEALNG